METVKAFDREWKKHNSWKFLMYRVCCILFSVFGAGIMLVPVERDDWSMAVWSFILLIWAVHFHIAPYLKVMEEGKEVNIYEKLKWMPVSKREVFAVRREYLAVFCLKAGAVMVVLQQIGACLSHNWGILNLLFPITETFFLFLLGIFDINRNLCQ